MATNFGTLTPKSFSVIVNDHQMKIHLLFLKEVDLMYSDMESNTYVLGPGYIHKETGWAQKDEDALDLLIDLQELNDMPLPFGQIMFFAYYGEGEFLLESATEKYNAHRAVVAFESFGYKGASLLTDRMKVSDQDKFKLMLKYGH
jgi:hypothetical protein